MAVRLDDVLSNWIASVVCLWLVNLIQAESPQQPGPTLYTEHRTAANNLLYALTATFHLRINGQFLETAGLCISSKKTLFIKSVSKVGSQRALFDPGIARRMYPRIQGVYNWIEACQLHDCGCRTGSVSANIRRQETESGAHSGQTYYVDYWRSWHVSFVQIFRVILAKIQSWSTWF